MSEEWYYGVQIIHETIQKKFQGWWEKYKYTKIEACIICNKEPDCLRQNWLTKAEYKKTKF